MTKTTDVLRPDGGRATDRRDGTAEVRIAAAGLTKRYGDVVAVEALALEVRAGEVYGFLGPNGAGKTTTIGMLTTLVEPSAGTATVAGHPVTDRDAVKPHIGYLPDEPPLYDAYTAREQLSYVATLRGLHDDAASDRIAQLLDRVGLADDATRRIDGYSQGMRQKVGLLQAILHEPDVVFLDEPTNGLDPRAAREVIDVVAELADEGTTVFLSSHILPVVEELADTVGVLHDGRLVAEGSPADLRRRAADGSERTLEQAFLEVTDDDSLVEAPTADADRAATATDAVDDAANSETGGVVGKDADDGTVDASPPQVERPQADGGSDETPGDADARDADAASDGGENDSGSGSSS